MSRGGRGSDLSVEQKPCDASTDEMRATGFSMTRCSFRKLAVQGLNFGLYGERG